jgi:phage/plasmid-like protein (TIGR03299 family)
MEATDQMYSVREAPWHMGMGTNVIVLDSQPETRSDRIAAAGHAFIVEEHDVILAGYSAIEGWKAITRSDTNGVLAVAKDSYQVVQNVVGHELFEVLAEGSRLDDGTGGSTYGGALCYLSARVDEEYHVKGDDSPIFPYVVVLWSHDGSGSLQARRTSVRPVCWNTISAGEYESKKAGRNFTFRHTKNVLDRVEDAKAVISGARQETADFIELANELADLYISDETREKFIMDFIPAPAAAVVSDRVLDNILDARTKLRAIFDSPTIPEAHRNTGYGALQAGIEYLDHLRGYRNSDTYLGRTLLRDEPLKRRLIPMVRELAR